MSQVTRTDLLQKMEFFQDFNDQHLKRLAEISDEVEFQTHDEIFREHEPAENVYLIVEGKVSLVICAPKVGCRQIAQASTGELIGWSPLLGQPRLSDTAKVMAPTRAIVFNGEDLLKLCAEDHDLGYQLMCQIAKVLADRLAATRLQLFQSHGMNLPRVGLESD